MATSIDEGQKLLRRLESGYSLPVLSVVAVRLVELASDEECSVKDLVGLIEKDPSLAIRLIRLANSAFFKATQPITTLQQAVMRIGFQQLRIMALSLSLRDTFPMDKVGPLDYEKFWRSSVYRALLAKSLAIHLKAANPEEAFVAGLTLGAGFLIFFDIFLKGKREKLDFESLGDLLEWEKSEFGLDHREVGEVALRFWKFPEKIILCQRGHLEVPLAESLARICEVARILSNTLLRTSMDFNAIFRAAKETLGITEEGMNNILAETFEEVEEIADNLKIGLNREQDLLALMERANGALRGISEIISGTHFRERELCMPTLGSIEGEATGDEKVARTLEAVAHEIRNPLVAVAGFARRLATTLDPSSKGGAYAKIILEEAMRLERALSDMSPHHNPRC